MTLARDSHGSTESSCGRIRNLREARARRTGNLFSGGGTSTLDCSGVLALDFNARIASGVDPALVAGAIVDGQFWFRDGAASSGTGLSEAIEFEVKP